MLNCWLTLWLPSFAQDREMMRDRDRELRGCLYIPDLVLHGHVLHTHIDKSTHSLTHPYTEICTRTTTIRWYAYAYTNPKQNDIPNTCYQLPGYHLPLTRLFNVFFLFLFYSSPCRSLVCAHWNADMNAAIVNTCIHRMECIAMPYLCKFQFFSAHIEF